MTSALHRLRLVRLSVEAMEALVADDLPTASAAVGVSLTPYLVEESWLWRIRLGQVAQDPRALDWIARAALDVNLDAVIGHVGFHGPPDERGMVEVAYSVDPAVRRRGYATSMLEAALLWAAEAPEVSVVRASVAPTNEASLATLRPFGFEPVGEQWDEEDGLELLFERPVR
jgi:[ribosomal protein S5]-alanine N-acetyltransferase